jgi:hypothetical protein
LVEGVRIVYNKGQQVEHKLTDNEIIDLAYKQKPPCYSNECEFRFVAFNLGNPCPQECRFIGGEETECGFSEYQKIVLGRPLQYVSFVE